MSGVSEGKLHARVISCIRLGSDLHDLVPRAKIHNTMAHVVNKEAGLATDYLRKLAVEDRLMEISEGAMDSLLAGLHMAKKVVQKCGGSASYRLLYSSSAARQLEQAVDAIRGAVRGVEASVSNEEFVLVRRHRKLAKEGDAEAQATLGYCLQHGKGVARDPEIAVKWYCLSAMQHNARAECALGLCFESGDGVEKDLVMAAACFITSAGRGYARAQFRLGLCFEEGKGVEKDPMKAVYWYKKSAMQGGGRGYVSAQYKLGLCLEEGKGVHKDLTEAVYWYRRSASQGFALAQRKLAFCLLNGRGIEEDFLQAAIWYRKAAQGGDKTAQEAFGTCSGGLRGVADDHLAMVPVDAWPVVSNFPGRLRARGVGRPVVTNVMGRSSKRFLSRFSPVVSNFSGGSSKNGLSRFAPVMSNITGLIVKKKFESFRFM